MKNVTKIIVTLVGLLLSIAILSLALFEYEITCQGTALWLLILAIINFIFILCVGIAVNGKIGTYECKNCKNEFKPTTMAYVWGAHTLTKRYLKCPKCGKSSWCRWKISE